MDVLDINEFAVLELVVMKPLTFLPNRAAAGP
jgi:hypothetical protein